MAYRKTEKVLAQLEAKRAGLIAASIDVIARVGINELTTDLVCERADVAAGLLYRYFPDKTELIAAVVAYLLSRDVKAIRDAATGEPVEALAAGLTATYYRLRDPLLIKAMYDAPAYRIGIQREIERLIRAATTDLTPKGRSLAAAGALGLIYGSYEASDGSRKHAPAVVSMALRAIGVTPAKIKQAVSN